MLGANIRRYERGGRYRLAWRYIYSVEVPRDALDAGFAPFGRYSDGRPIRSRGANTFTDARALARLTSTAAPVKTWGE